MSPPLAFDARTTGILTARTEDAEHCAYRLRCMMSQLRSARVDKISQPSKVRLGGVMVMAHITAPPSLWQRSNSKKTDASWEDETEDSHEINDTLLSMRARQHPKSRRVVTVSDEELDEVALVSDNSFDTEEKLDALMRNLFCFGDQLGSRTRRTCGCGERLQQAGRGDRWRSRCGSNSARAQATISTREGQDEGTEFESHCEWCGESLWKCLSA